MGGHYEGSRMSGVTWSRFYWSDWSSDPALKLCSLASQGLWMRLLCIASEAEPVGYVKVKNKSLNPRDIAKVIGSPLEEIEPLLIELETAEVFSRGEDGTIYCRRMIRDWVKLEQARKFGLKGGNPRLINGIRRPLR